MEAHRSELPLHSLQTLTPMMEPLLWGLCYQSSPTSDGMHSSAEATEGPSGWW